MSGEATYTPKQAAEKIGVSDQTIYRWIEAGIFQGVIERGIMKKRYHIPVHEVERVKREGNYEGNSNGLAVAA